MKTNRRKPFILATLALGLVLVMGLGANTFAKYITKTEGDDTARVAKFGYTLSTTLDTDALFAEGYNAGSRAEDTDAAVVDVEVASNVANSTAEDNLVAPGTKGSITFTIGGTAEVKVQVTTNCTITAPVLTQTSTSDTYEPIKWTLKKDGAAVAGNENVDAATVAATIAALDATVDANGACALNGTYTLEWKWDFYVDADTDALDTKLGWIMNGTAVDDYTATTDVAVHLDITVEQVQNS